MVKNERKRGFTLMEMLTVVAILAVTAAMVIPSVLRIRDALLFRQRNDQAKTIFLTAQRQLIRMRAGGTLAGTFSGAQPATPQTGDEVDVPPEGYVCVGNGDPGFDLLLPDGVEDGQVCIEFSPSTADVYAVFYGDAELLSAYSSGGLCREEEWRREHLLGYYSGDGLTDAQLGIYRVQPEVSFYNGQEGLVTIRVPTQTVSQENLFESGNYQRYVNGLRMELTISGERGGVLHRTVKEPGQLMPYVSQPGSGGVNMLCFTVPLDSLAGGSFGDNGQILPGDNVSIAAEISFLPEAEDPLILMETAVTAGINPMFASLTDSGNGGCVLAVSNGRNLQNLNAIAPEIAKKVKTVLISVGNPGKSSDQVIDWQATMDYYGGNLPFTPIYSPWLFGAAAWENDVLVETDHRRKNAEIVGCNTRIENLVINSDASFVGLFGYINANMDGLYLVNPRIHGGEYARAVGGLIGAAGENSRITDCGLLAEGEESFVSGSGAVGGFAGILHGADVRNCYALGRVTGDAGFAAENSGTIENCQANVIMEGGFAFVRENTGTVQTCYGWVTGTGALTVNGDCRGCYFAELAENGAAVLYDEAGNLSDIDNIDALASDGLAQLGDGWNPAKSGPAYPLSTDLQEYPYPMLAAHYGDWAVPGREYSCGVLYYERYEDGTVGVVLENLSQNPSGEVQPLRDGIAVLDAGYALWCRTGCQPFDENTEAMKGAELEGLHAAAGLSDRYSIFALESEESLVTVAIREGYDSATLIPLFADTIHQIQPPYRIRCRKQLENIALWGDGEFLLEGKIVLDETFSGIGNFGGTLSGAENSLLLADGMTASMTDTLTGRLQNIRVEGRTGVLSSGLLAETLAGGTIVNCQIAAEVHTEAGAFVGRMTDGEIRNCTLSGTVFGTKGSFVDNAEGGRFKNCHVTEDCSLPFAGEVTVTGTETMENATHYAESYLPDGRYTESDFKPVSGPIPIYGPVFENCSYLSDGQKIPVTALRYFYQLTSTPGWAVAEASAGQIVLVTEEGKLLEVNENDQIVADREFTSASIPETAIWFPDGENCRNLSAADVVLAVTDAGTVTYEETVSMEVTEIAADGTAVKLTEERTERRTLECTVYHAAETTDSVAVYLGKRSILTGEVAP